MSELTAAQLWQMNRSELRDVLISGHSIDPAMLDNTMYRGVSLGLPSWVVGLTWLTFRKTFYRDPGSQKLRGWNLQIIGVHTEAFHKDKAKLFTSIHQAIKVLKAHSLKIQYNVRIIPILPLRKCLELRHDVKPWH